MRSEPQDVGAFGQLQAARLEIDLDDGPVRVAGLIPDRDRAGDPGGVVGLRLGLARRERGRLARCAMAPGAPGIEIQAELRGNMVARFPEIVAAEGVNDEASRALRRESDGQAAVDAAVPWRRRQNLPALDLAAEGAGDRAEVEAS